MANWLLITLVVVATAGLFALAWWSSGRARPSGRSRTMSADQRLEVERTRFQHHAPPDSFGTNQR